MLDKLPGPLRELGGRLPKFEPGAEKCYRRAIELAPDLLAAHAALVNRLFIQGEDAKAEKAARRLLERFPDHIETLERLSDHLLEGRPEEALELSQRALKNNPLDRARREHTAEAHEAVGHAHALAGRFEEARRQYQAALSFEADAPVPTLLSAWAAVELKAKDGARAEELIQQAVDRAGPVAAAYALRAEANVLKLPPAVKKRFDAEVSAALKVPPSGRDAAALAGVLSRHLETGLTYHGQKAHVKKALGWLEKAYEAPFQERELHAVCDALLDLGASARAINRFLRRGRRDFPDDPFFPYHEAVLMMEGTGRGPPPYYRVHPLLEEAQRLARARPHDEEAAEVLEDIDLRLEELQVLNPFGGGLFERFMGAFPFGPGGVDFEEDDEDYEDDDDYWP
jgi:tetratricopeptide (TPR) repeat protein